MSIRYRKPQRNPEAENPARANQAGFSLKRLGDPHEVLSQGWIARCENCPRWGRDNVIEDAEVDPSKGAPASPIRTAHRRT
jgi:hypothetical protein